MVRKRIGPVQCVRMRLNLLKMATNTSPTIALKVQSQFNQHSVEEKKTPKQTKIKRGKIWQVNGGNYLSHSPPNPRNAMVILFVARLRFITQWANINAIVIWNRNITSNVCSADSAVVLFRFIFFNVENACKSSTWTGSWLFVYFFFLYYFCS